jgi:hypothetical protein
MKKSSYLYYRPKRFSRRRSLVWIGLLVILVELAVAYRLTNSAKIGDLGTYTLFPSPVASPVNTAPKAGDVVGQDGVEHLTAAQTTSLIRHNYPSGVPGGGNGITKVTFHYLSQLPSGDLITVYGRAYLPDTPYGNLPTFAFAPGTTGIGDQCAPSLEQPAKANWANYDSHMAAYATQGYAAITTDYEGMRDPDRIHHYMIGELEGRAVLDAIRALRQLPQARGRLKTGDVFLSGYSQGGHAAFWADKIATRYAPDVRPLGVLGFGPVMSVKQTLTDITRGANINWFGPNVVFSYENYYQQTYPGVILPARAQTLAADVQAHCIDTDLSYWGYTPVNIYTPEFIAAATSGQLPELYPGFSRDLDSNTVGAVTTPSAKRINQGDRDNVVLPAQQEAALPELCGSSIGPVQYNVYPNTTHYTTMLHSFGDNLAWMRALSTGQTVGSTCK